ncbi:hypothetical protein T10_6824 [Trichinella papuae]|uniref:Uncharacterized protein n=1 Tax=Trichinella papuae TaxID=268474 RepID=A0A0V1MPF2_9BILA|nr:hypothetical protein T10_6824 [Trichinella papuae]
MSSQRLVSKLAVRSHYRVRFLNPRGQTTPWAIGKVSSTVTFSVRVFFSIFFFFFFFFSVNSTRFVLAVATHSSTGTLKFSFRRSATILVSRFVALVPVTSVGERDPRRPLFSNDFLLDGVTGAARVTSFTGQRRCFKARVVFLQIAAATWLAFNLQKSGADSTAAHYAAKAYRRVMCSVDPDIPHLMPEGSWNFDSSDGDHH